MDEDSSSWLCTQAMHDSADDRQADGNNKANSFGCLVLNNVNDNEYLLNEGDNTIGRNPLNHIYIEHPSVSMNHAVIQCDSDGVVLLDKGSLNKTKLNKKTLKKNVAYFLEENACLMFGEVQANYYVDKEPTDVSNEVKPNAIETSIQNGTESHGFSALQLSCNVNTSNILCNDEKTDKIVGNNSSNKTESECTKKKHDDVYLDSNHSSPSDVFLLDALSQIESQLIPETVREDTPSPIMDIRSSFSNVSNVSSNILQTTNIMNSRDTRDDTPSPIMDFGPLENNELSTASITCHNAPLVNESHCNIKDLNETQCLEFDNNDKGYSIPQTIPNKSITSTINTSNSPYSLINPLKKHNYEIDNDFFNFPTQKLPISKKINLTAKLSSTVHEEETKKSKDISQSSKAGFSHSKNGNSCCHKDLAQIPDIPDDDFFNCPTQKVTVPKKNNSTEKSTISTHKEETQNHPEFFHQSKINSNSIKNSTNGVYRDLIETPDVYNDDFFNFPSQKITISKKLESIAKLPSTVNKEETQKPSETVQYSRADLSNFKNHNSSLDEDLNQVTSVDDDFFNCPTQKLPILKKKSVNLKLSSKVHEKETKKFQSSKARLSDSKNYISSFHDDPAQIPDMDDDFFNCPTQKVSVSKKIISSETLISTIHEEDTQKSPEFVHPYEINSSSIKNSSSGVYRDLTETPDINNEDFFNCPTQKLKIPSKLNSTANLSSKKHEEETQKPSGTAEFSRRGLSNSKNYNSNVQDDLIQVPDMDDDFFNCPTQKVSVSKKIISSETLISTIHEEDTQKSPEFVHPYEINSSSIKNSSSGVYRDLTETPDINNEDFFNCPTQKLKIPSKLNSTANLSSKKHEEETKKPSGTAEFSRRGLSNSKNYNSNVQDDLTQVPDMDDDFFNCPTQKVSVSKKIISSEKLISTIPEEDTQKSPEFVHPYEINSSSIKNSSSGVYRDLTETPDINNEDFFNCPSQKLKIPSKLNSTANLSSKKHEEETKKPSGTAEFNRRGLSNSKNYNSNVQDDLTQVLDMGDDFFNCPTQKVSVSKKIILSEKLISTIHEEDTQKSPEFIHPYEIDSSSIKNSSSGVYRDLTKTPDINNEDFFNCPTQKLKIPNHQLNSIANLSSKNHEEETQKPSGTVKFSRRGLSNSKNYNSNVQDDLTQVPDMDDDFFNCPTQKVSVSKKIISTIHEEDTQKSPEFVHPYEINSSSIKNSSSGVYRDLTETPDINNEDFFNCPTQKLKIPSKLNSTANLSSKKHEEETQKPSGTAEFSRRGLSNSKNYNSNVQDDLTQVPDMDDDFFNCPTQKVSVSKKIISSETLISTIHEEDTQKLSLELKSPSGVKNLETRSSNIFKLETQDLSVQEITRTPIIKMSLPDSKKKQNKENIFNKIPNRIQSNSLNISKNDNADSKCGSKLINQKITTEILPNDTEKCVNRKSMRLESNSNNKPCTHENKNSPKSLKTKTKPIICVRKDLHKSSSVSLSNNSSNNTNNIVDNVMVSANTNMNSPSGSRALIANEQSMVSSIKQEPFYEDSKECSELNSHSNKPLSKHMNETIFSPLNVPNLSESSFQQHSTPTALEGNSISLNCEPSCSNTAVNKWKSFWNKKKSASEDKGKSNEQENVKKSNAVEIKERYKTRAIAKKENTTENDKKRKQDSVIVEDKSKRLRYEDRENKLNPLIPSIEIVVAFSFLKNRHLHELKQFIDTTGGSVTNEITQCTVLVTDKIRCTMKILSAIAKGCPIVNANWIKHSYSVKKFQDVDEFLITDKDAERKYKFQLKESLARAKTTRLLEGYTVLVTPSVKPGPKDMKVIITCAGGKFIMNWPIKRVQKELIVTCDQDRRRWKPMWDNSTADIIDSDTLVMSIIRQKLSV